MTQAPERTRPAGTPSTTQGPAVGRPLDRVDGVIKTSGAARFSADQPYAGLAHAALVHAEITSGRVTGVDTAAAEAVDGVISVITHLNAPRLTPPPRMSMLNMSTLASPISVNLLNTDEVHWYGQPVAVVVAESLETAQEAARLVRLTYEPRDAVTDFAAAQDDATPVRGGPLSPGESKKGDAEHALAAAPVTVDLRFTTPQQNHNAIEPHATTAVWDGNRLTVHDSSQMIDWCRQHLALRFGVPAPNVRVIAEHVGGGFGSKGAVWPGTLLTVLAARVTGRPVRLALTREAVFRTVGGRATTLQRVALGAERDGTLKAIIHTGVSPVGRTGGMPEAVGRQTEHLYAAPNIHINQSTVTLDVLPNTAMRAPGEAVGSFGLECAVDALAHELGMDPVELRMRNEPERDPLSGKPFTIRNLRAAYERGAERFGWAGRPLAPRSMHADGKLVGWGVATALHMPIKMPADLTLRINLDGSVHVRCGFHEIGVGAATATTQITADALGVPVEAVSVEYGDTALPIGPGAGGSAQTASIAASVLQASEQLRRAALDLARRWPTSPLRGARPADVRPRDGGLYRADGSGESYAAILAHAGRLELETRVGTDSRIGRAVGQFRFIAGLVNDSRRRVRAATGAHFCEVQVDEDTGEVRVTRWVSVFDVGKVINPKTAGSQLRGGIVMGLGAALSEETLVDPRNGRVVNAGLAEYHVPVHADVPRLDVSYLDEPDPTTPLGLLGVGEVGITGVAAAVANAVHHATGVRVKDLPIRLDQLW